MKDQNQILTDLLLRAFDSPLPEEEDRQLQQALAENAWLRAEREQMVRLRAVVAEAKPRPDPDFADKVMRKLNRKELTFTTLLVRLAPHIAAACLLALVLALSFIYYSEGSLMTDTLVGIEDLTPEDADYFVELN